MVEILAAVQREEAAVDSGAAVSSYSEAAPPLAFDSASRAEAGVAGVALAYCSFAYVVEAGVARCC